MIKGKIVKRYAWIGWMAFLLAASGTSWAYDLAVERQKAMDWVHARRNGTSWVAVGETSDIGYTYDNALAIIAYTMASDFANARDLLNFLQSRQLADGSWYDSMKQTTGAGVNTARSSGNQAWALYAICFYTYHTGDRFYLPMAEHAASWLMTRQDTDGGIKGGKNADGSERSWTSTEHNVDSYFAFQLLYALTSDGRYSGAMSGCKSWLLNVGWNSAEGRFNRGENDPFKSLDTNTLGSLFLDDIKDYAKQDSAISYVETTFRVTTTRKVGNKVTAYSGFKECVIDDLGKPCNHWQEGTEQMAVSYLRDERNSSGAFYINEVIKSDDPAASVGHRDDDNDGDGGKQYYLTGSSIVEKPSPGLWQIFATNEYLGGRPKIFFPIPLPGGNGGGGDLLIKK